MWCRTVRSQLSAYADGELSPVQARALEDHLSRCEQCSQERSGIQRVVRLTTLVPCEEMPRGLQSRILAGFAAADHAPAYASRRGWRFSLPAPQPWLFAAGALALLAAG